MLNDLRALRRSLALTLKQAASGLMHSVTLCKIESGASEPRADSLRKLALRYHVTTGDIYKRWTLARLVWEERQVRAVEREQARILRAARKEATAEAKAVAKADEALHARAAPPAVQASGRASDRVAGRVTGRRGRRPAVATVSEVPTSAGDPDPGPNPDPDLTLTLNDPELVVVLLDDLDAACERLPIALSPTSPRSVAMWPYVRATPRTPVFFS